MYWNITAYRMFMFFTGSKDYNKYARDVLVLGACHYISMFITGLFMKAYNAGSLRCQHYSRNYFYY
jgi:hypothetical protein